MSIDRMTPVSPEKMRVIIMLFFLAAALAVLPPALQGEKITFNYIFLIDTSGSMVGLPSGSGNAVIFPKVKEAINDFIHDVEAGSNLFIYTFDKGINSERKFTVHSSEDLLAARDYINSLKAEGLQTWIYRSIDAVIEKMKAFREQQAGEQVMVFYVYSDGLDNDPVFQKTLKEILEEYRLKRGESDWMFFVTLGVTLPGGDIQALNTERNVKYISEEKGQVRPIMIIENKIPVLHYGNLWGKTGETRSALFGIHNKKLLPPGFSLEFSLNFPALASRGLGLTTSAQPKAAEKVDIPVSLVNFDPLREECAGDFDAEIAIKPSDAMVYVIPDRIRLKFSYTPPRTVEISPARDNRFPIDLGELSVHEGTVQKSAGLVLKFNEQAREAGATLTVHLEQSPDNPMPLQPGTHFKMNGEGKDRVEVMPGAESIAFDLLADNSFKPGKYSGRLLFSGEGLTVSGKELTPGGEADEASSVAWRFVIPSPPMSPVTQAIIWLAVLGLLAGAGYWVYMKYIKAKDIQLILEIERPEPATLNLTRRINSGDGKKGLQMEKESPQPFADSGIILRRAGMTVTLSGTGAIEIKVNGEAIYGSHSLRDGDRVSAERFEFVVSSNTLR